MASQLLQERLRDPAYLQLHLTAVKAIAQAEQLAWYDSHFLKAYNAACNYLDLVRLDCRAAFSAALGELQPLCDLFREAGLEAIHENEDAA